MARKLPVSIRARVQQQTAIGRGVSASASSGFIARERIGHKIVQEERLEASKQRALRDVVGKISKLTNLNDINNVLNSAPNIIRPQLEALRKNITTQQNETIARLQIKLTSKLKSEKRYNRRKKDAKTQDREDRARVREDEYEAEADELQKLIQQMKSGNLYDYSSVISRVNDVGRFEREKSQFRIDKRKAKDSAQKQTIKEIQKLGFTPVVNATTGKLLGYQGGKESGFTEYRFDPKGNPLFLKSNRFSPVRSRGVITGYIDKVAKMSIPAPLLQRHIANINKAAATQTKKFKEFQTALQKIKLPKGFAFERDKVGTIVSIDDKVRGINLDLGQLPEITTAYLFNPTLKRIFQQSPKELFKVKGDVNYVKALKLYEKFNPKKVIEFTYRRRYNFYKNDFGGKLSYSNFIREQWKASNKNFQKTIEGKKIAKALNKSLRDQVQNPEKYGTTARISGLLVAGSGVGLPSASLILFGSTYFGTLGVAKDVSKSQLPKNFKSIAKVVAKNFGMGAVQGLLYGLAFKGGSAVLGKIGKPLLKISFGAKAGVITKGTQLAIQRGLSIFGVNYVSRLAGRTTLNIKNIVVGDVELGAGELSKDIGVLVGFAIPTAASKLIRNKKINIQKKIQELEKFRKGNINAAYLKAKNAQLTDPSRGQFTSSGIVKQLKPNQITILTNAAKSKGITKAQLRDGSFYVQNFKVRSDVPKYEALLKVAKARARGKTIRIKSVPKFYTFKRYGVVVARQNSKGAVEAFAVEFNFANGKISNVGFKTAVGKDKITAISIYKKVRKLKGKPLRVKLQDIFVVKNKVQTKVPIEKGLIKIFNTLETKKVFLNRKKLSKNQILNFKKAIKKDISLSREDSLGEFLKNLYKNKGITSRSGIANTVRIQRIAEGYKIIPTAKRNFINFKVFPKGQYIEVGHTKFRIPSIKKIRILKPSPKPKPKPKRIKVKRQDGRIIQLKKVPRKPIKIKPIEIQQIKSPSRSLKLELKMKISKTKIRTVKTAVKSIQTIIKPRVRAGKLTRVLPMSITKTLIRQSGVLLPLVASKNVQAIKTIQRNLRVSLNIQAGKQINQTILIQVKALQSASVKALRNITLVKPITPIVPTIPTVRKPRKPAAKKPLGAIVIPKTQRGKRVIKKKKEFGYVSGLKSKPMGKITKTLISLPIAKERAFDILAYSMLRSKKPVGIVKQSQKKESISTIRRKLVSIPRGYFRRHRNKFLVRKIKGRVETFEVIRKPAKRKVARKKPAKKKTAKKKPAKRRPTTRRRIKRK
ncbi:hypothetical protein KAT51_00895 [bacterium]|nr:hypothetical protein [bacterium]